jgi:hypothetical protein
MGHTFMAIFDMLVIIYLKSYSKLRPHAHFADRMFGRVTSLALCRCATRQKIIHRANPGLKIPQQQNLPSSWSSFLALQLDVV